ncbi:MAG: hypothetical protein M3020_25185 [Myxococcota bacterium]|nr:hypothetical protein [Myxococcota bacterium]
MKFTALKLGIVGASLAGSSLAFAAPSPQPVGDASHAADKAAAKKKAKKAPVKPDAPKKDTPK